MYYFVTKCADIAIFVAKNTNSRHMSGEKEIIVHDNTSKILPDPDTELESSQSRAPQRRQGPAQRVATRRHLRAAAHRSPKT